MLVNTVCAWYSGVRREEEVVGSPAQLSISYSASQSGSPSSAASAVENDASAGEVDAQALFLRSR